MLQLEKIFESDRESESLAQPTAAAAAMPGFDELTPQQQMMIAQQVAQMLAANAAASSAADHAVPSPSSASALPVDQPHPSVPFCLFSLPDTLCSHLLSSYLQSQLQVCVGVNMLTI